MKIEFGNGGMRLATLAHLAGGTLRCTAAEAEMRITSVATDSREVGNGTLFLGIRGERVDGNNFAWTALLGGASAVMVERLPEFGAAILVDDTVAALGRIARAVRKAHPVPTVGVTGSVGKTTTKELLYAVLSQKFPTHASKGNFNSTIGLPMSVLESSEDAKAAVYELGMSAFLEIDHMTRIVTPDIAVITTIGTSHMEALGSRENIAKAKLEILNGMSAGSTVILNGDEPLLFREHDAIVKRGIRPLYVRVLDTEIPSYAAEITATNLRTEGVRTVFDLTVLGTVYRDLAVNAIGKHTVYAAAIASAVGHLLGLTDAEIRAGLLEFRNAPMRQSIASVGGITVIEDCYNASPESMRAALDVAEALVKQRGGRVMALLGDMRELGTTSAELHRGVGHYAAEKGVSELFTLGEESSEFLSRGAELGGIPSERIHCQRDAAGFESVGEMILSTMREGDVLLVKASRALRAERVVSFLKEHADR